MQILTHLLQGGTLSLSQAEALFEHLVRGELNDIQIAATLMAMKMRREQPEELAGAACALRRAARQFPRPSRTIVDSCGTGGDGSNTMNISTTAALVAASMGLAVAKHGNRSVSSRSGSADVLESLQLSVTQPPTIAAQQLTQFNFCFLFAPHYHPGIRYAMPTRQTLKTRTLFNLLGPLINPARPDIQLLGVYDPALCAPVAETLRLLDCPRAMVVHGSGLDELALHGQTTVTELQDGELTHYQLSPEDFGVPRSDISALRGGDAEKNARLLSAVFGGAGDAAHRHAIAMNVAAISYMDGRVSSLKEGTQEALEHLSSGKALEHLHALQEAARA